MRAISLRNCHDLDKLVTPYSSKMQLIDMNNGRKYRECCTTSHNMYSMSIVPILLHD